MKKTIVFLTLAVLAVGGVLCAKSLNSPKDLLEMNVEVLADEEDQWAPGEQENCEESFDDHCRYHYDNRNYNIERRRNK